MSTTFYFADGTSIVVGGGGGGSDVESVDYLPTFVNSAYGGQEGIYNATGTVVKMTSNALQYRWRRLLEGVVYRIHGNVWIIAEDQSLVAYKTLAVSSPLDIYIVGGERSRYVQYASSTTTMTAVGKSKLRSIDGIPVDDLPNKYIADAAQGRVVACFGDSITSGSNTNGAFEQYLPELCGVAALNFGSSGASSKRVCGILTGYGEGTHVDISEYYNANLLDTVFIMTGTNDASHPTDGQIPVSVSGVTVTPIADLLNGRTITVNGESVSSVSAYYALFGSGMCGQLAFMVEWVQAVYPGVRILLGNYHLKTQTTHKSREAGIDSVLAYITGKYGVEIVDIRHTSGINESNAAKYLADGIHPNEIGNHLVAEAIARYF